MNTKSTYFFLSLFMAPNKNFIKFMFGNVAKSDQGIKLTEISELIELFSFVLTQGEKQIPCGVEGIICAFISVQYPSH